MTNPIELHINNKRVNIGDPFILNHDGKYYLYYSTESHEKGINCFISEDLENWTYYGLVAQDEITKNAYAPEVIYYKGEFLMITSPSGKGHYIFTSESPVGPFSRRTENLGKMIDGSFYQENEKLYVLCANHTGITMHEVDKNYNLINRIDINVELNGWTEGPFLIRNNDLYYLVYCGNHLESEGYRVEYSISKNLFGPYKKGDINPLLISTKPGNSALGHNSIVLGPDLKTYYSVYHKLNLFENRHERMLCIDEIQFNGGLMKQNITHLKNTEIKQPIYRHYVTAETNFNDNEDYEVPYQLNSESVFEINFYYKLFLSIKNVELIIEETLLSFNNTNICVNILKNKLNKLVIKQNFNCIIYLNDQEVFRSDEILKGNIIIRKTKESVIKYMAFNYSKNNNIQYLPNKVFSYDYDYFNDKYNFGIVNNQFKAKIIGDGKYHLQVYSKIEDSVELKVIIGGNENHFTLKKLESPYEFNYHSLGVLEVNDISDISITIIKGKCDIAFLNFSRMNIYEKNRKELDDLKKDVYNLESPKSLINTFSVDLKVEKRSEFSRYGLIINATDYSVHPYQARYPLFGYFIGFYKNLLVVEKLNYGIKRIYDIPIQEISECNLEIHIKKNNIQVFINKEKQFSCFDNFIKTTGQFGVYSSEGTQIKYNNIVTKLKEDNNV